VFLPEEPGIQRNLPGFSLPGHDIGLLLFSQLKQHVETGAVRRLHDATRRKPFYQIILNDKG